MPSLVKCKRWKNKNSLSEFTLKVSFYIFLYFNSN